MTSREEEEVLEVSAENIKSRIGMGVGAVVAEFVTAAGPAAEVEDGVGAEEGAAVDVEGVGAAVAEEGEGVAAAEVEDVAQEDARDANMSARGAYHQPRTYTTTTPSIDRIRKITLMTTHSQFPLNI